MRISHIPSSKELCSLVLKSIKSRYNMHCEPNIGRQSFSKTKLWLTKIIHIWKVCLRKKHRKLKDSHEQWVKRKNFNSRISQLFAISRNCDTIPFHFLYDARIDCVHRTSKYGGTSFCDGHVFPMAHFWSGALIAYNDNFNQIDMCLQNCFSFLLHY